MSLNKVQLIGFLGKDPEIRSTQNGQEIANFSIATSESWKDKNSGEKKEKTEWHNITAFGAVVGVIKNYVKKGSRLYIEGKLETSKYVDKQGVEKYSTKIILQGFGSKLLMLDSKGGNQDNSQEQYSKPNQSIEDTAKEQFQGSEVVEDLDDDIPF